jgi:hypothetical protein
VDFGNHAIFDDSINGAIFPESIKYTTNILRVGINYRFGYRSPGRGRHNPRGLSCRSYRLQALPLPR